MEWEKFYSFVEVIEKETEKELHHAIKGISKYLFVDIQKEFSFRALNKDDAKEQLLKIEYIANEIKNMFRCIDK